MQSVNMLMGKAGGSVRVTELDCSVQEEDWERGRSYSVHWHSLGLISHPQDRQTVSKMDLSLRQSLSRQWEARRLLQPCFSGTMQQESTMPLRQNCLSGTMQQEATMQLRPPQICLRGSTQPGPLHPQEVVCFISGLKRATVGVGVRRDPTPVWSTVVGFTKLPRALGRVVSRETQRG
ncbi:uncharacterized protein ACWYII_025517 [Salvelinus alpinus]